MVNIKEKYQSVLAEIKQMAVENEKETAERLAEAEKIKAEAEANLRELEEQLTKHRKGFLGAAKMFLMMAQRPSIELVRETLEPFMGYINIGSQIPDADVALQEAKEKVLACRAEEAKARDDLNRFSGWE